MKKAWSAFRCVQSTPNFTAIILAQMVAMAANGLFDIVLIWYALKESSYVAASTVIVLQFVPYTVFGLVCGWLSDGFNRKYLIVGADLFRALIFGLAMAAIWLRLPLLPVLAVSAFFMTVARTVFQPALQGIIPELGAERQVVKLNAILHGGRELIGVIAPVIGGYMIAIISLNRIFFIIFGLFLISAFLALLIDYEYKNPEKHKIKSLTVNKIISDYFFYGMTYSRKTRSFSGRSLSMQ